MSIHDKVSICQSGAVMTASFNVSICGDDADKAIRKALGINPSLEPVKSAQDTAKKPAFVLNRGNFITYGANCESDLVVYATKDSQSGHASIRIIDNSNGSLEDVKRCRLNKRIDELLESGTLAECECDKIHPNLPYY